MPDDRSARRPFRRPLVIILATAAAVLVPALPALATLAINSFSPTSGPEGTEVAIAGTGFTNICSVTFNGVAALFQVNATTKIVATVPATNTGKIAVTTCGGTSKSSTASFTVLPFLRLDPAVGPPTTTTTVHGSGFASNEIVDVLYDGSTVSSVAADAHGVFDGVSVKVPSSAEPGNHLVTARGEASNTGASATFLVRTDWSSFRNGTRRRGLNPYENTLSASNVSGLDADWIFNAGAIIESSPAVVRGIVYVGAGNGNLYALNSATGAQLWSADVGFNGEGPPSPVRSSPAVANGVVYVGADNGALTAIDAASGAVLWSLNVGDAVESSPVVANGVVYFGSDSGSLFALNAVNGAFLWEAFLGGAVSSSPAVADGVIYVGSGDPGSPVGHVSALTTAGNLLWSFDTRGPVTSTPAVAGGRVYVGSDDGSLYAISTSTGSVRWSLSYGGQITSSPAVANGVVYVATPPQCFPCPNLFALNAHTGQTLWGSEIGGASPSPTLANGVLYVGDSEGVEYAVAASSGALLWRYTTGFSNTDENRSSPAVADGVVYVGSSDRHLYAFDLHAPLAARHRLPR